MNGTELIDDIDDIVSDPRFTRAWFLARLNRGLMAVAGRVLLPGLADGSASINTVLGNHIVTLPETYHRTLYQASINGAPVRIYPSIGIMRDEGFNLNNDAGSVLGVSVNAGSLFYQRVPAVVTAISLRFYRKPTALADTTASYPDGLGGSTEMAEMLDQALVGYVCNAAYSRIEDGIEGQMVNTNYHLGRHEDAIDKMSKGFGRATPMPEPPVVEFRW